MSTHHESGPPSPNAIFARLRDVCAELYGSNTEVVLHDAGMIKGRIEFSGIPRTYWQNILDEAIRQEQLAELVAVVRLDYPCNRDLQRVLNEYDRFVNVGGKFTLIDHSAIDKASSKNKRRRQFVAVFAVSPALVLLILIGMTLYQRYPEYTVHRLVKRGEQSAKSGDYVSASRNFEEARKYNPPLEVPLYIKIQAESPPDYDKLLNAFEKLVEPSDKAKDPILAESKDVQRYHNILSTHEFWIMRQDVTKAQYKQCMDEGICTTPADKQIDDPMFDKLPVKNVTYEQAKSYAKWIGGRLPNEEEWTRACLWSSNSEGLPASLWLDLDNDVRCFFRYKNVPFTDYELWLGFRVLISSEQ